MTFTALHEQLSHPHAHEAAISAEAARWARLDGQLQRAREHLADARAYLAAAGADVAAAVVDACMHEHLAAGLV